MQRRYDGESQERTADRQYAAVECQLPPRWSFSRLVSHSHSKRPGRWSGRRPSNECRKVVVAEMQATGYLRPFAWGRSTRRPEAKEKIIETKRGIDDR